MEFVLEDGSDINGGLCHLHVFWWHATSLRCGLRLQHGGFLVGQVVFAQRLFQTTCIQPKHSQRLLQLLASCRVPPHRHCWLDLWEPIIGSQQLE